MHIPIEKNAQSNYDYNSKTETTSSKNNLVNNQAEDTVKDLKIGDYNVGGNGCGAVAIHNAKISKNVKSTLSNTIYEVQANDGLIFNGVFGVNPYSVGKILKSSGIDSTPVSLSEINKSGTYLIAYWNSDSIWDGAHFVTVKYDGNNYTTYNGPSGSPHEYAKRYIYGYYIQ